MRNKKTKMITLSLASVLGAATLAGGIVSTGVLSSAETKNAFEYTSVFKTGGSATLAADKTDATKLAVSFPDGGSVALQKRDLALKWYNAAGENGAGYFSFKFSLADTNFETLSIVIESASAWATKDEKTTNTVTFKKDDTGVVSVSVNDSESSTTVADVSNLTLSLGEHADYGSFNVYLNETDDEAKKKDVGDFVNVGANFAENTSDITPFKITAELPETEEGAEETLKSVMIIKELNGQSFALKDGKVEDNALPVVVINEEINGFMVGTTYNVTAEVVDVIDTSPSLTTEFYQYDPTDTEAKYEKMPSSNKYLPRTYYEKSDGSIGCVYEENGMEYFSVRYAVADDIHTLPKDDDGNVKEDEVDYIELVWYAEAGAVVEPVTGSAIKYIKMDRNERGPWYTNISEQTADGEIINVLDKNNVYYKGFVEALEEATEDLEIGSDSYVYLPTMKGLIDDDNGYKNLKFTVSYKTETATSPSTSSISSASDLKFSISKTGLYEFKIIASDKAGNPMQYYLDGELVDVTTSNVWDIDAIPSFSFVVQKSETVGVEDGSTSDRMDTESLNSSYSFGSLDITGLASGSYTSEYALYKIDTSKYNDTATKDIQEATLYSITYAAIQDQANELGGVTTANGDYMAFYKKAYAFALANKLDSANADTIAAALLDEETGIFREIEEFDSRINKDDHPTEWKKNNKYNWNASSGSFTTADEGYYMVLAVYSDKDVAANKAAGYKIVISSEKEDVIEGETQWLKNNLVSVILFGVAGVMLILIIILLFVKPSDETLEDVDAKALKARKAKEKKKK